MHAVPRTGTVIEECLEVDFLEIAALALRTADHATRRLLLGISQYIYYIGRI